MEISRRGHAAIIATDKGEAPAMVTKVAGIMGARLFTPGTDLLVEKKRELASGIKTNNDHERDSLAAAMYAYYNFQNKIRRVEKQVEDKLEEIKAKVLNGEKVADIFETKRDDGREKELLGQISQLRKEIRELQENLSISEKKHVRPQKAILREAAREAKGLMIDVAKGKYTLLREVSSINYLDLKNFPIKKGDFIFCQSDINDGNGLRFLESRRVGAIITPKKMDSLMPSCKIEDLEIINWEGLYFAESAEVEKACGRRKEVAARDLHDMLVDYKKGRR